MSTSQQNENEQPSNSKDDSPVELAFQAEVQEVLSLVINSLYTHKEVFLRELISNASDALDKARFSLLTKKDVTQPAGESRIAIHLDEEKRTLRIEDNGIGMTREEVIKNLGTIARSGSAEFVKAARAAAENKEAGLNIIGQFGVGFYSAFMVAARVDVHTRSMQPGSAPVIWRSSGSGSFTVLPGDRETPGTEITVYLKEEEREYAKPWRVKEIIRKYSDFVQFPIYLEDEAVNRSSAIWAMPKSQVTEEQYTEFFRRLTGSEAQSPLLRVHLSVDAPVQFHALLYVPEKAPLDLFSPAYKGLRLYAKRVLIAEDYPKLVPTYLRFLRGVVDSEDLPLNVSREILQEDKNLHQIEQQLTRAVLRALKELSESDPEKYDQVWTEFGRVLKEGLAVDWKHKDELAELCRFESLATPVGKRTSLKAYVATMPSAQREIYYVTGPNRAAVEHGPHIEAVRKHGFDALFLIDPVDEWVVQSLTEYDKRRLKNLAQGDIDLGEAETPEAAKDFEITAAVKAVKSALGERVSDVRLSKRLTDSAACLVSPDGRPSANLERLMRMMDGKTEESARILELNPGHPIVKNLDALAKDDDASPQVKSWAEMLFSQALLAEGVLRDPALLAKQMQDLLTEVSGAEVAKRGAR